MLLVPVISEKKKKRKKKCLGARKKGAWKELVSERRDLGKKKIKIVAGGKILQVEEEPGDKRHA